MFASSQRVFEIPSWISVFLLNVSCWSEPFVRFVTIHTRASATSVVAQPASLNRSACPPSNLILTTGFRKLAQKCGPEPRRGA